jgi:hypothetical protein
MRGFSSLAYMCCALALFGACGPDGNSGDDDECPAGTTTCGAGGACVDLMSDEANCGACGYTCDAADTCIGGVCMLMEQCEPNSTASCYTGPLGTENVGPCHGGTRTCNAQGTGYGPCTGEVTPQAEICDNGADEDCTGTPDDAVDADGDGYRTCDRDCCDRTSDGCTDPALVNPGAFDVAGNMLDDDCDGTIDNGSLAACDTGLASNSTVAMDYAKAMELCQTADENAPPDQRTWGVVSATLVRPDGSGQPQAVQRSIRQGFGATAVQAGQSFTVLSTGHAADANDVNPGYAPFQGGVDNGATSGVPGDWLAANSNNFPNAPGCPEPQGGTTAHDPIMLELRIRAPSNAKSFKLKSYFYSSEYPEWVCSPYNDFFVVLLDSSYSGQPANPADKNLATYTAPGGMKYPVGVNLAFGNTGLFTQCLSGPTGCGGGSVAGNTSTCMSTADLAGTGFDVANPPSQFLNDPGWCGASNLAGGGTGWLVTSGNVVGGEIFKLRIAVWDTGDQWYDSVVLLDAFEWSLEASQPGTVID